MKALKLGGPGASLGPGDIRAFLDGLLAAIDETYGSPRRILVVPPDQTRLHSRAGEITVMLAGLLGDRLAAVLPATGTHRAMGPAERASMYPGLPEGLFLGHDHRNGTRRLGSIETSFIEELSGGRLHFAFPGDFSRELLEGGWDLILSIGQVVPHEVVGMANYTKNFVVGLGGAESIDLSHWLGAVVGLENVMGRADTPVRRLLDESARRFLDRLPIVYIFTVISRDASGKLALRGLFAGPSGAATSPASERGARAGSSPNGDASHGLAVTGGDEACVAYREAAALSAEVNIETLERPLETCVVRLDPSEFRSTWLGNKAVYRTRMAMATGGELFVLAPGVDRFGEDPRFDALIRRHGYRGTEATLEAVDGDPELAACLAAAAHLVHGSSEGRFRITYCTEKLTRAEVEGAGYSWMSLGDAEARFGTSGARDGWNDPPRGGEPYFFVSNPAIGLWKRADT